MVSGALFQEFQESRQELARARALVAELEDAIARFFASQPFEIRATTEPATGLDVYRMRLARRLPRHFAVLTRRAADAQLAALDALARVLAARYDDDTQPRPARAGFPFCQSAAELDDTIVRRWGNAPPRVAALLREAAPYPAGNPALHALTGIHRTSTWRLLKPAVEARTIVVQDGRSVAGPAFLSSPSWNERRHEVVVRGKDPDSQLTGQARVGFFVAFRHLEVPLYRSVPSLLAAQIRIVSDLIEGAESLSVIPHPPRRSAPQPVKRSIDARPPKVPH